MRTRTARTSSLATAESLVHRARPLCALLCVAAVACSPGFWRRFDPVEASVPSTEEDRARELGFEFDHELARKVKFIDDPVVAGFVFELGQAIVRETEPQPFVYRFRVIDSRSLNAFAVFGGYVYLHRGTLLAAGSIDELAGVLAHEIAHVRQRHHARMAEKTQLPDLLAGLAGIAAVAGAAVAGEPGVAVAGQGIQAVNEAIKLRFSRGFEAEADYFGTQYMSAAGYSPLGLSTFFERLIAERRRLPTQIPPYLYTHPAVEDRISAVEIQAESLPPAAPPQPDLRDAFREAQARLAALEARRLKTWIEPLAPEKPGLAKGALDRANAALEAGDPEGALVILGRASAREPNDPRLPYRSGEILQQLGRTEEAIARYQRTVALDSTHALVFFRLGEAYESRADVPHAVYSYEQAAARAGSGSSLQRRAEWQVEKLSFPVVREVRVGEGASAGARVLSYTAQLGPHFARHADRLRVRWVPPGDQEPQETPVRRDGARLSAPLELPAPGAAPGRWEARTLLDGDVVDVHSVRLASP